MQYLTFVKIANPMSTLIESTEKLVAATDRLLQGYQMESSARKADSEKAQSKINELEAQLMSAQSEIKKLVEQLEEQLEGQAASAVSIPNPPIQSHDSVTHSADQIDALVEEIDSCLSSLNLQIN
jgi:septal ring factor EnvC (AmiA/AmiB activator)